MAWQRIKRTVVKVPSFLKKIRKLEALQWVMVALSAVGVAYAILALSAAYLSLVAAEKANRWAYYSYELALNAFRTQIVQLCTTGSLPEAYATACQSAPDWSGFLKYLIDFYKPPPAEGSNPVNTPSTSTAGDPSKGEPPFASTAGGIVVITFAVLSFGMLLAVIIMALLGSRWRRMGAGHRRGGDAAERGEGGYAGRIEMEDMQLPSAAGNA